MWILRVLNTITFLIAPVGTLPNLCDPNPCQNGGKCKFLQDKNDYICEDCLGRFTGKDCSGESRIIHHLYFNVANLQKLIARNACMLTLINLRATSPTQHFAFVVSVYVGKSCLRLSLFYCYEYYSCGSYVLF